MSKTRWDTCVSWSSTCSSGASWATSLVPLSKFQELNHDELKHDVVQAYLADLTPYPPGSLVRVRNDAVGVVLHVYPDSPDRPRIALVQDGAGRDLAEPVLIELLETDDADHSIAETLMRPSHSLQSKH